MQINRTHKQIIIKNEEVDEGIADLLSAIWKHRIHTYMSCQEDSNGNVWLCFESKKDLFKFLDKVDVAEVQIIKLRKLDKRIWFRDASLRFPKKMYKNILRRFV